MKTAVIALTKHGSELAARVGALLGAHVYIKEEFKASLGGQGLNGEDIHISVIDDRFTPFVGRIFDSYDALVFIMASGIVARSIAPFIINKTSDPAVIVMDEKGSYVISLLSGHMGGANKLSTDIARKIGGTPVITTSTDVNGVTAFDVFAVDNHCVIENIENLKFISSELVNGGKVGLYSHYSINGVLPDNIVRLEECNSKGLRKIVILSNSTSAVLEAEKILYLRPKNLIIGIGCRKGTSCQQIETAIEDFLKRNEKSFLSVKSIATVDVKKDEEGILDFSSKHGLELKIISRDAIRAIEGDFTSSDFVKGNIGVGSVCEPCAVLAGQSNRLICSKTVYKGITLALSEEEREYYL